MARVSSDRAEVVDGNPVLRIGESYNGVEAVFARHKGLMSVARDTIKIIEKALKKGFGVKSAAVRFFTEKSDYKDFVRMYVISDFFRGKSNKERLGEIYEVMKQFGAKDMIEKVSLCVAMTEREYEREFGRYVFLGVDLHKTYRGMKSRQEHRSPRILRKA